MPLVTDIADAVVAELNSGGFSSPFEAERRYLPLFDLEAMEELHVTVVPKGVVVARGARGANAFDVSVDVAVQRKVDAKDESTVDPLVVLVEEIGDRFRRKRLDSFPDAIWTGTTHEPVYAVEHLERMSQFTSVMTLAFRVYR